MVNYHYGKFALSGCVADVTSFTSCTALVALLLILVALLFLLVHNFAAMLRDVKGRIAKLESVVEELSRASDVRTEGKNSSSDRKKEPKGGTDDKKERAVESEQAPRDEGGQATDPLDGIIAQLTRECGGNVHENGLVIVTSSGRDELKNVVDLGSNSSLMTHDSPNSWICYDFKGRRVTPTSYSIRSHGGGQGGEHLKSWVLEVSNDESEGSWAVVDSREDNEDLNDQYVTRNFSLGSPPSGAFRFVRLRQTEKNHKGKDVLAICALELFGTLSE